MKSIDKPSRLFWFVTLPQTLLAACLIALLAAQPHAGAVWMLALCAAVDAAFTAYAIARRKLPEADKPILIALAAAAALLLGASMQLLDGAYLFGAVSLRLIAMLLGVVTALYAVLALIKVLRPHAEAGKYMLGLVALPLAWFLAFNIFTGVRLQTIAMILIVAGAMAAVFLIIRIAGMRGAGVLATSGAQNRKLTVLYSIFSIGLPLVGLTLNISMGDLFGDFSAPAFFIIPIVNGVLLLIPSFADKRLLLLRFFLVSGALVYFLYFFVVFIPYMPIGLLGLIYVVGALLFAPAAALALQFIELIREWRQLLTLWGGGRVLIVFIAALLLIPACMVTSYIGDRQNLNSALSYLETSETTSGESVSLTRLQRALDNSSGTFEISRDIDLFSDFSATNNTPLISAAYSALVLDNKVMKDGDIDRLRRLFFNEYDETEDNISDGLTVNGADVTGIRLTDVTTQTVFDKEAGAYRTWVNLKLQSPVDSWSDEYVALFSLPEGAYVSDYYLDVMGERKYGILGDDRAAMATYEDIVRVSQDPGVLHYTDGGQLELRVFPFSQGETRSTGFEVIHSQSCEMTLGGQTIPLDVVNAPDEVPFNGGVLVSADMKKTLPEAGPRNLSYWFIIDSSAHSSIDYELSMAEDYAAMEGIKDAQVIFAAYDLTETTLKDARRARVSPRCGFNLALAVRQALSESDDGVAPVIIFVSGNPAGALLPQHSAWLAKQFPESPNYYRLRDDMKLIPYEFDTNKAGKAVDAPVIVPLKQYHDAYVRDDGQSEIVPDSSTNEYAGTGSQYADALALDAALSRDPAMDKASSLRMLRASFRAHVLTPQTSFIVVETAEQEAELMELQERLLENDSATVRETLDEPPLALMMVLAAGLTTVYIIIRRKRMRAVK
jgi:hypothetical protein